ncbi:DUF58 domain-containing protein [Treponema sp. OttesenSCG-928-L16]|nr:DUF58 domain-containing protein [Treponema sp. OttesenSCG-928-L16]
MKPGIGLIAAALIWLALGTIAFFSSFASFIWFLAGIIILPFVLADALVLALMTDRLTVDRRINTSLSLGETAAVSLRIGKGGKAFLPLDIRLFDIYPASMDSGAFPARLDRRELKQSGSVLFEYKVTVKERGEWEFPGTELLFASPLRCWKLKVFHEAKNAGRTYPDFKKLISMGGTELKGIMEKTGIKNVRRRGQGLEFRELRDYHAGDPIRSIDWRATGRRQRLIVREYQEEQDQQILFLLDSGYRLHRREGEFMQFDSALNAVILLSYVALKHGDSVAVGCFGNEERWIGPRKGMSALSSLMNHLYDVKSAPLPSSPFSALETALTRLHRRSFIVIISNFREEDGESLSWILPRIERRHLLLAVSLRELEAEKLALRRPGTPDESLESAAAFNYLYSRRQLYQSWEHQGLLTLEASSAGLSPALINRYLSLKRSGRL